MSETLMVGVPVHNVPPYAKEKQFIIATLCDGVLWFYGATDSPETALAMEQESPQRLTLERTEE